MSLHRSLKTQAGALEQHRNVLTRAERVAKLSEKGKFNSETDTPIGLPKVASRKVYTGKKKKTGPEEADAAADAEK